MTFIKYRHDGRAVIQPAALILSDLDRAEMLEMHTLKNALVLFKKDMAHWEQMITANELMKLASSLLADRLTDSDDEETEDDEDEVKSCEDEIRIPPEAFEDAGIWGEELCIHSIDGAVIIIPARGSDDE